MLSATGILNATTSLEVSVGTRPQLARLHQLAADELTRSAAGLTGMPLLYPDAVQADYIP